MERFGDVKTFYYHRTGTMAAIGVSNKCYQTLILVELGFISNGLMNLKKILPEDVMFGSTSMKTAGNTAIPLNFSLALLH